MIGKLRCDADLQWLYHGKQTGVGRPKEYDGKVNFDDLERFNLYGQLDDNRG